jgi:hypothetical protein
MSNRLPSEWITLITDGLTPTGIWADFNPDLRTWRKMKLFVEQGLISADDLPDEPDPSDYMDDFDSPTTRS